MRPTCVTGLVLLWLLTNATWAFSQEKADEHFAGTGGRPTTKLLTEENAPSPIWQAEGYGKTEKDAVNLGSYLSALEPLAVVPVKMELADPANAVDTMLRKIAERKPAP